MDLYTIRDKLYQGKSIYELPLRVTFYARVSTGADEQLHSLKAQIGYYEEFIKKNPNWVYVEGYCDEGKSGKSVKKRENFLRMIRDAKAGKFDFIITKEISRFARNTLDSIKYTQELLACGTGVYFQADNINTLQPDAELRLTIMASIAQDELRKLSERVKFGFKRSIENGVVLGASNIWGYQKAGGKLVIDEEQAKVVRRIFELYATQNMGIRSIAKQLYEEGYVNTKGEPIGFSTVRGILVNPKYKGYYCGHKTAKYDYMLDDVKYLKQSEWRMYKDEEHVPAIVSEELWNRANRILQQRALEQGLTEATGYNNKYAYSGKLYCGMHQQPYYRSVYKYKNGSKEVWQCKVYRDKGKSACSMPVIYTQELNRIMGNILQAVTAAEQEKITESLFAIYKNVLGKQKMGLEIETYAEEIKRLILMKEKLLELNVYGKLSNDEFAERNLNYNKEIAALRGEQKKRMLAQDQDVQLKQNLYDLQNHIRDALRFQEAPQGSLVDSLVERMMVCEQTNLEPICLSVHLRPCFVQKQQREAAPEITYFIERKRNEASVCYTSSILSELQLARK